MLDQNICPFLVLGEPHARCQSPRLAQDISGEARESTNVKVLGHLGPDVSRGGQLISLSGSNGASTSAVVDRRRNQPEQVTDRSNVL